MAAVGVVDGHAGYQALDGNRGLPAPALPRAGTGDRDDLLHLRIDLGPGKHRGNHFAAGEVSPADRRTSIAAAIALSALRSEERRVGKEGVSTGQSRGSP